MEWTITTELNLAVKRHWKNLVKRMIGNHRNGLRMTESGANVARVVMATVEVVDVVVAETKQSSSLV